MRSNVIKEGEKTLSARINVLVLLSGGFTRRRGLNNGKNS
jgi:hypothetical protein